MIFHENRLPFFFRKFRKISQNLSYAGIVIGALRVKNVSLYAISCSLVFCKESFMPSDCNVDFGMTFTCEPESSLLLKILLDLL